MSEQTYRQIVQLLRTYPLRAEKMLKLMAMMLFLELLKEAKGKYSTTWE